MQYRMMTTLGLSDEWRKAFGTVQLYGFIHDNLAAKLAAEGSIEVIAA